MKRTKIFIIIGTILAITIGATVFTILLITRSAQKANLANANYDAVLTDLIDLATRAQQYYRIPAKLGGGGMSFRGLNDIQMLTKYPDNAHGRYIILDCSDSTLKLQGTGVERNASDSLLQVRLFVRPDTMYIVTEDSSQRTGIGMGVAARPALMVNQKFLDVALITNHNHVLQDLMMLGGRAQQYYRRPSVLGGGNGSFKGLNTITKLTLYPNNENGRYKLISSSDSCITLQGIGVEKTRSGALLQVRMEVMADKVTVIPDSSNPVPTEFPETPEHRAPTAESFIRMNHDAVLSQLLMLAAQAQQYSRLPTSFGGGNGSFRNLDIRRLQGSRISQHGTYTITSINDSLVILEGICMERKPDDSPIRIQLLVTLRMDSVISDDLLK